MNCTKGQHSPRIAFAEWQWCRSCGAIRHPNGRWESPTGQYPCIEEATEPAIRTTMDRLTAEAERDAQIEALRTFAKIAAGRGTDAEKVDRITKDFAAILRSRHPGRTPPTIAEPLYASAERVLFTSQNVDADEAAVALAALLKAAGVQVRLWAGRQGESMTVVVSAYDSLSREWIHIDPMGGT